MQMTFRWYGDGNDDITPEMIRQIPGTEEVTMTTNGVLLGENLEDLLAAGLDAVNISLDTLIPEKYQEINGTKYPFDDKKIVEKLLAERN